MTSTTWTSTTSTASRRFSRTTRSTWTRSFATISRTRRDRRGRRPSGERRRRRRDGDGFEPDPSRIFTRKPNPRVVPSASATSLRRLGDSSTSRATSPRRGAEDPTLCECLILPALGSFGGRARGLPSVADRRRARSWPRETPRVDPRRRPRSPPRPTSRSARSFDAGAGDDGGGDSSRSTMARGGGAKTTSRGAHRRRRVRLRRLRRGADRRRRDEDGDGRRRGVGARDTADDLSAVRGAGAWALELLLASDSADVRAESAATLRRLSVDGERQRFAILARLCSAISEASRAPAAVADDFFDALSRSPGTIRRVAFPRAKRGAPDAAPRN